MNEFWGETECATGSIRLTPVLSPTSCKTGGARLQARRQQKTAAVDSHYLPDR